MNYLDNLASLLSRLSGVTSKQAKKIALDIALMQSNEFSGFISSISDIKSKLKKCEECNSLISSTHCEYCNAYKRDKSKVLIVQDMIDLDLFFKVEQFEGIFFVIEKLISPLNGVFAFDLPINQLKEFIAKKHVEEVIFGLDQSVDAEATILYLMKNVRESKIDVDFYRLARGLPIGAEVEFSAPDALNEAIKLKQKL